MTTAKLSGDKLKQNGLFTLYHGFLELYKALNSIMDDCSPDIEFKRSLRRQLDSVEAIIRKEYKKSIGL